MPFLIQSKLNKSLPELLGGSLLKNKINLIIRGTSDLNLPEQQVESVAFAWLANQTLDKKFNNSPDVTGAKGFRVLGSIHQS